MPLGEIKARTAHFPKRAAVDEPPVVPKQKLTGLDLAALALEQPAVAAAPHVPIPEAKFFPVQGAALGVAEHGAASFARVRAALDGIEELPVRQRAFLRVLETFGSEWVPDATSRAMWNGTAAIVGGLKKRNLWAPFEVKKPAVANKLDPAEQERFIDEVLAPSWSTMVADTAGKNANPENLRALIELESLWRSFAKGFWPGRQDALPLSDATLTDLVQGTGGQEAMFAAGAIAPLRKAAAEAIADRVMPGLSKDEASAVLYVGEKNAALRELRGLAGARLAATHPLASWHAWVNEPEVREVKTWISRLHAMALALPHLEAPADALWNAWSARLASIELGDVETAAKVQALAQSLRKTPAFGFEWSKRTLAEMPPKTVFQLALMPVVMPKLEKGKPLPPDPVREVRDEAAQSLYNNPALAVRLLDGATGADDRRERLKLMLGALEKVGAVLNEPINAAVSRTVNALLADPSTVDEAGVKAPSERSLQTLLFAAQRVPAAQRMPLQLDAQSLAKFLPQRASAELAGLLSAGWPGGQDPWIGAAAAVEVRAELLKRLDAGTLEPHQALLTAAIGGSAKNFAHHEAALATWLAAQAKISTEQHGAALLALGDAFRAEAGALVRNSFAKLPDPTDRDSTEKMFGLAKKLESSTRLDTLVQAVADRAPLELVLAPYLEDYPRFANGAYDVDRAFRTRLKTLDAAEANEFLSAAKPKDAPALTERIGLLARAACGVGRSTLAQPKDRALTEHATAILEQAVQPALVRLAELGDPTNEDQRRAVLFMTSGARAFGAKFDLSAGTVQRFAKAASTEDLLKLCLDASIAGSGPREAANAALEERIVRSPIGEKRERLRAMLEAWEKLTGSRFSSGKVEETRPWKEWVGEELTRLDGKPWSPVWSALEQQATAAIASASIATRVDNVVALYPPSRDRNVALSQALRTDPRVPPGQSPVSREPRVDRGSGGIPFSTLESISSWELERSHDTVLRPDRRLLSASLLGHPDGPFALLSHLEGRAPLKEIPPRLDALWSSFDADAKQSVAQESFEKLFTLAYGDRYHSKAPDLKIRSALEDALETEVFQPLRRDPDLSTLVDRLQPIFAALPRKVQARVATAFALSPPPAGDAPAVLRCLLENAGVVAIKVAQQICEDPEVPQRFRDVLESLRDQNLEVDSLGAWSQIGRSGVTYEAGQRGYTLLGKRLGTGSVKQANRLLDETNTKPPAVIAFLKPGAAEEIEESLRALAVDQELEPIVGRVRSMLMRELDLHQEAQAFRTMAEHLAPWDFIRVPKVFASSREALVREMSPGTPVSAILRERTLDQEEKRVLGESYRSLVQAALDPARFVRGSGFVLTDPHQGNVALERTADGRVFCDLFDPGQFEKIRAEEASMFVRLVVHLSKDGSWFAPKKDELVEQMSALLEKDGTKRAALRTQLREAWDRAGQNADPSDAGEFVRAWLFAAADRGVPIPDAYFGMAKMLHTIDSQCRDLGLADVIREEVSRLYKAELPLMKAIHKLWPWS